MKRIGLFGGSFDPIHLGHLNIAALAHAQYGLDCVYVIPAHISPFKTARPPLFDDETRWRMVTAACAPCAYLKPWDIELRRSGVSYTVDTVRAARAAHPDASLYFIVGEDSLGALSQWKDWDVLQTLCTFVSYPRTRESSSEIRRRVAQGETLEGWVPPAVAEIVSQRLK